MSGEMNRHKTGINAPRFGNWDRRPIRHGYRRTLAQDARGRSIVGSHLTARQSRGKVSKYKGIKWCAWKGINGMWAAMAPGPKGRPIVVGYFRKEHAAVEARRDAMARMKGGREERKQLQEELELNDPTRNFNSHAPLSLRPQHLGRTDISGILPKFGLQVPRLPGGMRDVPHDEQRRGARMFRRFMREHSWHPAQHEMHRERALHQGTLPTGGATKHMPALPAEPTGLIIPESSPKTGHKFKHANLLDMSHRAQIDRLHRERVVAGQSYNNMFRRSAPWTMEQLQRIAEQHMQSSADQDPSSNRFHHHHKNHSHTDIFGHAFPHDAAMPSTPNGMVQDSIDQIKNIVMSKDRRLRRHHNEPPATPPSLWPTNTFRDDA